MENVQGLHYRTKDGPTMQFWPTHQHHDFLQGPTLSITPQSAHLDARSSYLVEEAANLHNFPLSWARYDERNGDAVGSRNYSHNFEWDSVRLINRPASDGNNGNVQTSGQLPWGVREAEFSSPSPPDNFEENGAPSEPTLLEFGLTSSTQTAKEDDGLLDLKLGGNNTRSLGLNEASPSVKRSRHSPPENQQARCQVDSCSADLQNAKDYHRRHKVCEFHAKEPKASVAGSMQRFCQQCSRFHLLKEFDDDRRSCRKRLAGHNRRRRKTQPDATATLACLLADPSVLAKIVASLGQQQGKEELEILLQGNPLVQTLWNTKAAEGALPHNLINALSKSQLLSNLLLSNSTLGCTMPAVQVPPPAPPPPPSAEALISALSSALLASLPQLQQKANVDVGHDGSVPVKEIGQPQGPYTNVSGAHPATKQNIHPRYSVEEQSGLLAFPNPVERPPLLPTTPPVYSDKSNDSNGDSIDERIYFDSCQRGPVEGLVQQDRRHWKGRHKTYDETTLLHPGRSSQTVGTMPTRGYMHVLPGMRTSPPGDHFETTGGGSDHSSDSGLDKQEHTGTLWFKIFDKNPSDLPPSLRNQILAWLDHSPTDMEGHIKPGCIILTVFVCMPVYAWEKLCRNIERSVQKLVSLSDGDFWRTGRVLVHVGDASAFIIDGMVHPNMNSKQLQIPTLAVVQPFAIVVGETVNLMLRGSNLKIPGTKAICAYEGKCMYKQMDLSYDVWEKKRDRHDASQHTFGEEPDVQQEQAVTFNVGPFNNIGRSIIEVEGHSLKGNAFPIVIAEKSVSEEINLLERKYVESCENKQGSATTSSSTTEVDIIHFLYELGWLLQRGQRKVDYIDLKIPEFSISRYRWLLRFSVQQSFCAVVGKILDILFSTDESSTEHAHSRAQAVLSDVNLLHVAVQNKSKAMVEFLVAYSPPGAGSSTDSKREYYFRPDIPICDGFTPLHVAAGMRSADDIVDALTDAPEELWATAWTSAKDSFGQTPFMYALKSGNHRYVKIVQNKLQKLSKANAFEKEARPPHLALSMGNEDVKYIMPPPKRPPFAKQIQHCACKFRESQLTQGLPLRIRGLNKGFIYRPFVLSMLAVAAVCVCVGVLMRGSPDVSFMQGPFVWESIRFGAS